MTAYDILQNIQNNLKNQQEQSYFWTHSVRYQFTLEQIMNLSQKGPLRILDIGCFPYHMGKALEELGHAVYGIASRHEPIQNKHIAIVNIEKEKFPYKDNFFDLVLFNEVIEHLPQSPVLALREIYRVTKNGGYMMITTPNIARSINRGKLLLGKNVMYPTDVYFEENGKGNDIYHRHNREYTLGELATVVQKTGWKIAKQQYFISYTPFRKRTNPDSLFLFLGKYINYILMKIFSPLQDNLYILAKK